MLLLVTIIPIVLMNPNTDRYWLQKSVKGLFNSESHQPFDMITDLDHFESFMVGTIGNVVYESNLPFSRRRLSGSPIKNMRVRVIHNEIQPCDELSIV